MNPLSVAAGVVSLLSEMVAREYRRVQFPYWPDGEMPLVDGGIAEVWATMPQQVSAGSAIEARVDAPAEGPEGAGVRSPAPSRATNVTAGLLIAAAHGLREYTTSRDCEAPTYWCAIADQLDPKAPR